MNYCCVRSAKDRGTREINHLYIRGPTRSYIPEGEHGQRPVGLVRSRVGHGLAPEVVSQQVPHGRDPQGVRVGRHRAEVVVDEVSAQRVEVNTHRQRHRRRSDQKRPQLMGTLASQRLLTSWRLWCRVLRVVFVRVGWRSSVGVVVAAAGVWRRWWRRGTPAVWVTFAVSSVVTIRTDRHRVKP